MGRHVLGILCVVFAAVPGWAAVLEVPTPHTTLSGIGVISGWKCHAGELTARFNDGEAIPLLYGVERQDVLDARACDHATVGFISTMNWGELGDGQHTVEVYDNGVRFFQSTFNVVRLGEAFVEGASGECLIEDFPVPDADARFSWSQSTQHLELVEVRDPPPVRNRSDLVRTIPGPQGMAYAWWHWAEGQASLEIDVTLHTNVPDWSDDNGLYLAPVQGRIADTGFYFGLQTDVSRPGVGKTGKGVIFSRWETRDLADARTAPGGFAETAGYEGDFISVRRPYAWSAGTYRLRLARYDRDRSGDWFGLWITDTARGRTTWIGALRFPCVQDCPATIAPSFGSWVEVYGGTPIRLLDIPAWHVSITAPLGGWEATLPVYVDTVYHDRVPNADIWYQADENAIHMRTGGTTQRQTRQAGGFNRYWLPEVE